MANNLSDFPDKIDEFETLFDLPASLANSAKRYQELKMMATLDAVEQEELNRLTLDLGGYIITPQTWNKFSDGVVNTQRFFKEKVDGYIDTKQDEWAGYVKAFRWVGNYNASTTYVFQNQVTYGGDLYLCLKKSKGVTPKTGANWQKISSKGDKGDVGLNTHLKGDYSSSASYVIGDAVRYNGSIYYCIKSGKGVPPTNSSNWHLYDKMFVGPKPPGNKQVGMVWIQTME